MIRTIAANLEQVAELSDSRLNKDRMLGAAVWSLSQLLTSLAHFWVWERTSVRRSTEGTLMRQLPGTARFARDFYQMPQRESATPASKS